MTVSNAFTDVDASGGSGVSESGDDGCFVYGSNTQNTYQGTLMTTFEEYLGIEQTGLGAANPYDTGPAVYSDSFHGFDMLLFVNLTDTPLAQLAIGTDADGMGVLFVRNLQKYGFMLQSPETINHLDLMKSGSH